MHADILMCTTNAENSKHYSDGKFLDSSLEKYWCQRYDLFREWESGILLDSEAWYSTTPVIIAEHQADVCLNLYGKRFCEQTSVLVLDMFCGVGGNAIAFAKSGYKVIACDTDSTKLKMAKHNAGIAGVESHIDFICCDFRELVSSVRTDLVFLSPPWGGPSYVQQKLLSFSQESIDGLEGVEIIKRALIMTNNVVCFLPRNTDFFDVLKKCKTTFKREVHRSHNRDKACTVYFLGITDSGEL